MPKLSVAVITLNNEKTIQDCLASVSFADEILIVDGESSDRTLVFCHSFTDKVLVHPFSDYISQVQYALQNCQHEWVLLLFADERVRPELATEITDLMSQPIEQNGFFIARRSYFLNKWIRYCGWYPDFRFRLVRKDAAQVYGSKYGGILHSSGSAGKMQYDLDYNLYPTLHDSLAAIDRKTSLDAKALVNTIKVRWYHFIFPPAGTFLFRYVIKQGFRAGVRGFLLCWLLAFTKMVLFMKIWLLQHAVPGKTGGKQ